ncbi:zinc-dependent alcohol dehydrogenase family protein [Polyangium sp. y55x31]|uniref:zinc-dependent alcohol dehydrogenase family protein n=1 Tax=Polyangium sp. y55x31 TaxID=3042688 RepID=UPI002482C6EB|nr:zinc-dependent alcohol dehydrogenase family protein [Polyangium sp. y55x31]MDI1475761.1 zinc-dependent alcohol dehydrogenase family protein [Polyangium sp. y55x31]
MRALVLTEPHRPLELVERPDPTPGPGQVLLGVRACAVCRTDLHILDGELADPKLPLIPGHQIVGKVLAEVPLPGHPPRFSPGARVGVPWLGFTCGKCAHCLAGRENLCDQARFTGYQIDGGFAERAVADARYCFPIPEGYPDLQAAPLLCAGLIGYRTLRMAGDAERIGIYGFGAAAHLVVQVARYQGRRVFGFVREGDEKAKEFALHMGAEWAGASNEPPPVELDAALIFAPAGELVPAALRAVRKGGTVVCGGIHMSDIPSFPYSILWGERVLRSVANLTRRDGEEFLALAPQVPVQTEVNVYPLEEGAAALSDLRHGRFSGAAVLVVE